MVKDDHYRHILDELYRRYNRRSYVEPDPLQFLYGYDDIRDREIAAFIASSLAYGRVSQIIRTVASVLDEMNPSPHRFISDATDRSLGDRFSRFRYRFTSAGELTALLRSIKRVLTEWGSLKKCFAAAVNTDDETVAQALCRFIDVLGEKENGHDDNSLLPRPSRGSACKRLNLFLRWMVRHDDVDPGGWDEVPASQLIIPLDTHMHRTGVACGITNRKQGDMRTALEMTRFFRKLCPGDPVRYDFVLTRLGIRDDMDRSEFLQSWKMKGFSGQA
jgi:uncharacterized protein (TIGR02757 family)